MHGGADGVERVVYETDAAGLGHELGGSAGGERVLLGFGDEAGGCAIAEDAAKEQGAAPVFAARTLTVIGLGDSARVLKRSRSQPMRSMASCWCCEHINFSKVRASKLDL